MPKAENPMDEVVGILTQEIREQAGRLATDLFPKGIPGHRSLSKPQELELVARHWHEPQFRKNLLERMAPPGPNGYPDPIKAQEFIDLYTEAVLKRGTLEQDTPGTPETVPTQRPVPQGPMPLGGTVSPPGTVPPEPQMQAPPHGPAPTAPPATTPPQEPGPTQIAQNIQPGRPDQFSLPLPEGLPPPPEYPA